MKTMAGRAKAFTALLLARRAAVMIWRVSKTIAPSRAQSKISSWGYCRHNPGKTVFVAPKVMRHYR